MIKLKTKKFWQFSGNEEKYINEILKKGIKFKSKSYTERLENLFSKIHKVKYSISVNSCSRSMPLDQAY